MSEEKRKPKYKSLSDRWAKEGNIFEVVESSRQFKEEIAAIEAGVDYIDPEEAELEKDEQ